MSRRYDKILIDAKTDQNEVGYFIVPECAQGNEFGFDIEFSDGSAAGQVVIETAADNEWINNPPTHYAGTWAIVDTVNWAAASKSHHVAVGGSYRALRSRISIAITTGTVTVRGTINGNPT